jgi:hypothetical protein
MSQNGKASSIFVVGAVASLMIVALLFSNVTSAVLLAGWVAALTVSPDTGWAYPESGALFVRAYTFGAVAFVLLVDKFGMSGVIVPTLALLAVAVPFFVVWWMDHRQQIALAIAYILVAAIPILLIQAVTDYEAVLITLYVLLAIGVALVGNYRMTHVSGAE